jgi:SSS family solute:Na+ symporter
VLGAKDLRNGQLGAVFAGFLKILPPFLFMLPGILCFALHPDLEDSDAAFITMVTNYLPVGMVGLIVAVLIAALISTIDSGLNSFSTVFTLDIYVKNFRPNATPKEIKLLGRVVTVAAAGIAILIALSMADFGKDLFNLGQSIISSIAPPMATVFLIGVLWKRATEKAAVATLIVGSIVSISIGYCQLKDWPSQVFWPHYLLVSFYVFAGLCAFMIMVSLLTKKSPGEEDLPTIREAQQQQGSRSKLIWPLWGVLAVIMFALYVFFN